MCARDPPRRCGRSRRTGGSSVRRRHCQHPPAAISASPHQHRVCKPRTRGGPSPGSSSRPAARRGPSEIFFFLSTRDGQHANRESIAILLRAVSLGVTEPSPRVCPDADGLEDARTDVLTVAHTCHLPKDGPAHKRSLSGLCKLSTLRAKVVKAHPASIELRPVY